MTREKKGVIGWWRRTFRRQAYTHCQADSGKTLCAGWRGAWDRVSRAYPPEQGGRGGQYRLGKPAARSIKWWHMFQAGSVIHGVVLWRPRTRDPWCEKPRRFIAARPN